MNSLYGIWEKEVLRNLVCLVTLQYQPADACARKNAESRNTTEPSIRYRSLKSSLITSSPHLQMVDFDSGLEALLLSSCCVSDFSQRTYGIIRGLRLPLSIHLVFDLPYCLPPYKRLCMQSRVWITALLIGKLHQALYGSDVDGHIVVGT